MRATEFLPPDIRSANVRPCDCDKIPINIYLRRCAAKSMVLELCKTFVLLNPDA